MSKRSVLLLGSMPFEDEEACMRRALDTVGPYLFSLPDGEVGEKTREFPRGIRSAWVIYAVEVLTRDTASWRVVKPAVRGEDGMAMDYGTVQQLKPLRSPGAMADYVHFDYDGFVRSSYPIFQRLRHARGLDGVKFQMGVPTGFAMGFAFASKINWLRYTSAFNTVIAREVNAAVEAFGDDLIVQIEVPPEMYAAYMLPTPLMGLALRPVHDLLNKIHPGTQIGMHLCLGDFHNEALVHPKTLDKMVKFSNRLIDSWPTQHRLVYMHYPFAEGAVPPALDADHYRPLNQIRLLPGTRFVAGFAHEKRTPDENKRILAAIEAARGTTVDVACSCGLGRRTPEVAQGLLELQAALAEA
jgi:hypothetical protein